MAKAIASTPTLKGDVAKKFIDDMKRDDTLKEVLIKERIGNNRRVKFL